MLVSALALCLFCVLFTTKLSRQRAENVRCEVADPAGNRQLKHGARQPEVGFFATGSGIFATGSVFCNRKWVFCIHGQWFYPNIRQIVFIRQRTLSSTILVALGMINGRRYHFRLTRVAEKRLCLSSPMSYTSVRVFGSLLTVFWWREFCWKLRIWSFYL